jgi:hypothetical protein
MNTNRVTATPKGAEAFGALWPTDFEFNALGKLSINDAALAAAIGRNRQRSLRSSCDIINPIPPFPPPRLPHEK